jgi:hypothetical protein
MIFTGGYLYADNSENKEIDITSAEINTEGMLVYEGELVKHKHGIGHKLLFYIPNRFLDLIDVVRARVRVGPGLSYSLSVTKRASFFLGEYNTVYAGLPGPRAPKKFVSPVGRERQKGIILMGVDATDDTDYPPRHGLAELQFGLQALIIGGDVGVDFWELGDFFSGLILIDLRKDDL